MSVDSSINAVIYARVSTPSKLQRQDVETQLIPARDFISRHGWKLAKEYTDDISAIKNRPAFESMLDDARQRKFDVLAVVKIDRLARSLTDFVNTIRDLDSHGIRFISITQGIDTDQRNPASRLLMNVLAAIAEFERELIRERIKAGIARRKAQGKPVGASRRLIDNDRLRNLRVTGKSVKEISSILGVSESTVHRRLRLLK